MPDQQQQEQEQQQVGQDVVPPGVNTTLAEAEQVEPKCLLKRSIRRRPSGAGWAALVMLTSPSIGFPDRPAAPPLGASLVASQCFPALRRAGPLSRVFAGWMTRCRNRRRN